MKQKVLVSLMTSLACAATAAAASFSWLGTGTTTAWTDASNWWNIESGPTAVAPAAGDFAFIGFPAGDFSAYPRPVISTVLYTVANPLTYLCLDYWDANSAPENSQLTITAGGGLEVSNTLMNNLGMETATINITGGYLRSHNQLHMAMTAGGTSQINIDSGFMVAQTLVFGPGTSNIDLEPGAALYIGGNQTANMASWTSSGKISGGNGSLDVEYDLTTIPGYTTVRAVAPPPSPGPIPIANNSFEADGVADNTDSVMIPASWTWQPFGASTAPHVIDKAAYSAYGIAGAHSGDQYFLGHAGGADQIPLIHQDTALPWSSLSPGDTLTFSVWATYRSDFPGNNAVSLWLNFWDDIALGVDSTINSTPFNVSSTGASAPGEWTQYVWNHTVTQSDIDEAALEGWGKVNVQISFYGSQDSQVAFDDVSLLWTVYTGPPFITAQTPTDNSSGLPVASDLVATFNTPIALTGSGSITLKNLSGGADIPITLPGNVSINGKVLTINPPSNLAAGQEYAVEISADAIKDLGDPVQSFAGLLSTDAPNWSFTASPAGAHVKVFLLGGQSNAVGTGLNSELPTSPVNLQQPQYDVLFYHSGAGLTTLRPGTGGNNAQFGPEVTFGRAIADASPAVTYAIIKYAVSGTNLYSEWAPGTGPIYTNFRNTVDAGIAALQAAGYTTEIVGMLWHQGESDAILAQQANYQTNLTAFISDVRSQYGANLPFLIGEVGNIFPGFEAALNTVIAAQQVVATADPYSVFVPAKDLPFLPDNIHFTTAGQIALGERFATGYATLVPPGGNFADWIADLAFGISPGQQALSDDPDGDGIDNGVENYFGTNPGGFSQGIVAGVKSGNTFTFTHPISDTPASDLTATYRWSKDLSTFTPDAVAFEGSTVTFTPGTPAGGFVTVTASVTGTPLDKLFVDVMVTQD